ncbi:Uncharacterized protein Adt_10956 [Abeliophyllum distichum]|uniref:Uncharacterized protein n=1 Tax=Abeliophyllum distichum TaxID=126358 RepID=A0ABD1ULL5_9LAMI
MVDALAVDKKRIQVEMKVTEMTVIASAVRNFLANFHNTSKCQHIVADSKDEEGNHLKQIIQDERLDWDLEFLLDPEDSPTDNTTLEPTATPHCLFLLLPMKLRCLQSWGSDRPLYTG